MQLDTEELLHFAAKACKISWPQNGPIGSTFKRWNPIEDNSDCLDMAFKLNMVLDPMGFETLALWRLHITMRAARVGRSM